MELDLEQNQFVCRECSEKTNLDEDYMNEYVSVHNYNVKFTEEEQNIINQSLEKTVLEVLVPRKMLDDVWNYFPELVSFYKDYPEVLLKLRVSYSSNVGNFAVEVQKKDENAVFSINKIVQKLMWGQEKELDYPFLMGVTINCH